jgi:hypothetical protein
MTKIGSKNSLYPHSHFTEHLIGAFEKSLRESDLNQESSSLLICQLKSYTGFSLQRFKQQQIARIEELVAGCWE